MNFLAHAWLAREGSDDFLYGNLIADGVKGSDLSAWPSSVEAGIRHHRRVDAVVDSDAVVLGAKSRAPRGHRRYAGIALDVVWAHFLARQLGLDTVESTRVWRCYRLLEHRSAPARLAVMMPAMVEQDWLHRYADFTFTCRAISGLGRRLSGPNRLAELIPWLEADYLALADDFDHLWPSMKAKLAMPGRK
jgi:acyl carrier protein phosphodiesterase